MAFASQRGRGNPDLSGEAEWQAPPPSEWAQERLLRFSGAQLAGVGGEHSRLEAPQHTQLRVVWAQCGPKAAPLDCTEALQRLVRGNVLTLTGVREALARSLSIEEGAVCGERGTQLAFGYRAEVCFSDDKDPVWGRLATFYPSSFEVPADCGDALVPGRWNSLESFYQACKFPDDADLQDIMRGMDADEAHETGQKNQQKLRADWQTKRTEVMYEGVRLRFNQCSASRAVLLRTQGLPIIWKDTEDDFWGVGKDGQGLNRLGEVLRVVYKEITLPQFVPKELFFGRRGKDFSGTDFTSDGFLQELTHKVLQEIKKNPHFHASAHFEALFRGAAELLEMNERSAAQTARHCAKHLHESVQGFMRDYQESMRELDKADRALQELATKLAPIEKATVHTGEALQVMNTQIRRAAEAAQIIEHFDAFCRCPAEQVLRLLDTLKRKREHARTQTVLSKKDVAKGKLLRIAEEEMDGGYLTGRAVSDEGSASDGEDDRDFLDDGEEDGSQEAFSAIPQEYRMCTTRRDIETCVAHFVRLKGLVEGWGEAPPQGHKLQPVDQGKQNVLSYDNHLAQALCDDFEALQDGCSEALLPHEASPQLVAALRGCGSEHGQQSKTLPRVNNRMLRELDRIFLSPMRGVAEMLLRLGHGHRSADRYVQKVFHRLRVDLNSVQDAEASRAGPPAREGPIARLERRAAPPAVLANMAEEATLMRCVRREAFVARRVFHPHHQGVLKSIVQRIIGELDVGVLAQVQKDLDFATSQMQAARRVQDAARYLEDHPAPPAPKGAPPEPHGPVAVLHARLAEAADKAARGEGQELRDAVDFLDRFCPAAAGDSLQGVFAACREAIGAWVTQLHVVHSGCVQWGARVQALLPECADSVRQGLDEVFARYLKYYHFCGADSRRPAAYQGAEGWLLEAVIDATPPPQFDDDEAGMCADVCDMLEAAQKALERTAGLCRERHREPQILDLAIRLQTKLCQRFAAQVRVWTYQVIDELRRSDPRPEHPRLLQAVSWAVTGREKLLGTLRERFSSALSGPARQRVAEQRRQHQQGLEHGLGKAVAAACRAIAYHALKLLQTQGQGQGKFDYYPEARKDKDRPVPPPTGPTATCRRFCGYLGQQIRELDRALAPLQQRAAMESAHVALAQHISRGVYAHVKGLTVSPGGAVQFKQDCTGLLDCMKQLGYYAAGPFVRLHNVAGFFMCEADDLPVNAAALRERLADLPRQDLEAFLLMRADARQSKRQVAEVLRYWDEGASPR